APHEQREEAGHRVRDDQDRPVRALEAHAALVERDREEEAGRERKQHRQPGVDEGPDEDAEERAAVEGVRDELREVALADVGLPAALELVRRVADVRERALAVVLEDDAVADPDEPVSLRVVAERWLELHGLARALRLNRGVPRRR